MAGAARALGLAGALAVAGTSVRGVDRYASRQAMTQRMQRSAAELEQAFAQEVSLERQRRSSLLSSAERRSRKRHRERTHRRGKLRFIMLVITLVLTAVLVTVAMFAALYLALR